MNAADRTVNELPRANESSTSARVRPAREETESLYVCKIPWYEEKEKEGRKIDFGTTASLMLNPMLVHDPEVKADPPLVMANAALFINASTKDGVPGWSVTRSDLDQINQVVGLLVEDLRQGVVGVGVGAAYMVNRPTICERFEAQPAAARYGRLTSVHTRVHVSNQPRPNPSSASTRSW